MRLAPAGDTEERLPPDGPSLTCLEKALPVGNGELGRRKGPRNQDRGGDDHPGARLIPDDEPCAERQDARLQGHPEHAGYLRRTPDRVGSSADARRDRPVGTAQRSREAALHPQGGENLGVAPSGFREAVTALAVAGGVHSRLAGHPIGHQGEQGLHHRATDRCQADQWVEQEADRDVDRDQGRSKKALGPAPARKPRI